MSTVKLVLGTSAATVLTVAALAGCAKTTSSAAAAPASSSLATAASSPTASASVAASAAPSGASGGGAGASVTACLTSDLSLQVIQGAQAEGSSTRDFYIQLTNTSAQTCTLYGYPGVDFASSNGASLGMKDDWTLKNSMSGGAHTQTLAPNTSSAAYVTYVSAPASQTAGDPLATEVRVIPPNQTTALTAKIGNLYQGDIQLPVVSKTLTVGPMDIDGVPHA
jgi:hypothetical protein